MGEPLLGVQTGTVGITAPSNVRGWLIMSNVRGWLILVFGFLFQGFREQWVWKSSGLGDRVVWQLFMLGLRAEGFSRAWFFSLGPILESETQMRHVLLYSESLGGQVYQKPGFLRRSYNIQEATLLSVHLTVFAKVQCHVSGLLGIFQDFQSWKSRTCVLTRWTTMTWNGSETVAWVICIMMFETNDEVLK